MGNPHTRLEQYNCKSVNITKTLYTGVKNKTKQKTQKTKYIYIPNTHRDGEDHGLTVRYSNNHKITNMAVSLLTYPYSVIPSHNVMETTISEYDDSKQYKL